MIIAIDGFSSCGKSTIAKALARVLHLPYIDTGAMYRAVTWYFIQNQIDYSDTFAVHHALQEINLLFKREDDVNVLYCNGQALKDELRTMDVSALVSEISTVEAIRNKMVRLQQQMGEHGAVMDGRDIGTVVFPDADYKFFLIANPEIRAKRRFQELQEKNDEVSYEEVLSNIIHRDHIDSTRTHSPLRKADDAIEIDNSYLTKEEQIEKIMAYIRH